MKDDYIRYQFGAWEVDPNLSRVRRGAEKIHLEYRAVEVLRYLLDRPGQIISHDELLDQVWEGRAVEPSIVHRAIHQIRHALSDSARNSAYIETIPKRGYRTIASIKRATGVVPPQPALTYPIEPGAPQDERVARKGWPSAPMFWVATLLLFVVASAGLLQLEDAETAFPQQATAPENPSIAVLPFSYRGDDADQDYLTYGIAEEVLSMLARNQKLKVISRASSFSIYELKLDPERTADKLGVDRILQGSVRHSGDLIRITAELIDTDTTSYLWTETYESAPDELLQTQVEIATDVARALSVSLVEPDQPQRSVQPEVYALYSRARYVSHRGDMDPLVLQEAAQQLERALEIDPNYVPALRELGRSILQRTRAGLIPLEESARLRFDLLSRALEIDPDDAVTNAYLAWHLWQVRGDYRRAAEYFEYASRLDPTNVDVLRPLGPFLLAVKPGGEALRVAEYLVDRGPMCAICMMQLADIYIDMERWDEAEEQLLNVYSISQSVRVMLELGYLQLEKDEPEKGLEWFAKLPKNTPEYLSAIAVAYHRLGRLDEYQKAFDELRTRFSDEPLAIARVYLRSGDVDNAFLWLDRATEVKLNAFWNKLWSPRKYEWGAYYDDPRWLAAIAKVLPTTEVPNDLTFEPTLPVL